MPAAQRKRTQEGFELTRGGRAHEVSRREGSTHLRYGGLLLAALWLAALLVPTSSSAYIYWTNPPGCAQTYPGETCWPDYIGRGNLDGTDLTIFNSSFAPFIASPSVEPGSSNPEVVGQHIYWTEAGTPGTYGWIDRANLDGTGVEQRIITLPDGAGSVAITQSHVYWTETELISYPPLELRYKIMRTDLAGTGSPETVFSDLRTDSSVCRGIAVDGAHLYWATGSGIGRANLDGSNPDPDFINFTSLAPCSDLEIGGTGIFWSTGESIGRANLDGTGVNPHFIDLQTGIERGQAADLAVDGAHIYWVDPGAALGGGGELGRANLDGTGIDTSFIWSGYGSGFRPTGVAVDGLGPPIPVVPSSCELDSPHLILGNSIGDSLGGTAKRDAILAKAGADTAVGRGAADCIFGAGDDDRLSGHQGGDSLFGGVGNDVLRGNIGSDLLSGNAGADQLSGGKGHDEIRCGPGADTVIASSGGDSIAPDCERVRSSS
jgi:RTX calcium-binding nonapeptide repeat (4 copies)